MEAPEFLMGGRYYGGGSGDTEFLKEKRLADQKLGGDHHFTVDDLLDFTNDVTDQEDDHHGAMMTDGFFDTTISNKAKNCTTSTNYGHSPIMFSTTTGSCNSSSGSGHSFADSHFSGELCVPYDELAELEWLSNFVDDSFSTGQNLQANVHVLTGSKPTTPESSSSETQLGPMTRNQHNPIFQPESPLPGKARSKRSRVAPCDWSTRLLHVSPTTMTLPKKQGNDSGSDGILRKCLHCASEKTPQWRTGPMGPKTLCNACGVRYKSGRLVPEYRPASSPTFVSSRHSNSHRKVLELRRQKELREQFLSQSFLFGVSDVTGEDFLFHHRKEPDFRHLI